MPPAKKPVRKSATNSVKKALAKPKSLAKSKAPSKPKMTVEPKPKASTKPPATGAPKATTKKSAGANSPAPGKSMSSVDSPELIAVAARAPRSAHFGKARNRAEQVLRDPGATERLADEAEKKINKKRAGKLSEVIEEVRTLIRLLRAFAAGEYRAIGLDSLILIAAALVYLVSPIDLIPDFLPGGLIDDAAVMVFVLGMVYEELDDFRQWELKQPDAAA